MHSSEKARDTRWWKMMCVTVNGVQKAKMWLTAHNTYVLVTVSPKLSLRTSVTTSHVTWWKTLVLWLTQVKGFETSNVGVALKTRPVIIILLFSAACNLCIYAVELLTAWLTSSSALAERSCGSEILRGWITFRLNFRLKCYVLRQYLWTVR